MSLLSIEISARFHRNQATFQNSLNLRRPKAEGGAEGEAEGVKREALKARSAAGAEGVKREAPKESKASKQFIYLKARSAAGAEGVKREAPKESKASKQLNNRLFSTGWDGGGSLFS